MTAQHFFKYYETESVVQRIWRQLPVKLSRITLSSEDYSASPNFLESFFTSSSDLLRSRFYHEWNQAGNIFSFTSFAYLRILLPLGAQLREFFLSEWASSSIRGWFFSWVELGWKFLWTPQIAHIIVLVKFLYPSTLTPKKCLSAWLFFLYHL